MSVLEKRNLEDLVSAVSGLIDIQVDDSTTPSFEDVTSWLNEGAVQVFRIFPVEEFRDAMITQEKDGAIFSQNDFTHKLLKIVSVYRNSAICTKLTEEEFGSLSSSRPLRFNSLQPAYCRRSVNNNTVISVYPGGGVVYQITYLPYPYAYDTSLPNATPDNTAVPASLEHAMIEYAAILARIQDEEPAQFQLYINDWRQKIQMAYGVPNESIEGAL
jgi:hypothetical protein